MLIYLATTFFFALSSILVYAYYLKNGQFEDIEDIKYQMFREEDDKDLQ